MRAAQPQSAQDRQILLGNKFRRFDQRFLDVLPPIVDRANRTVGPHAGLVEGNLAAAIRLPDHIGQGMRGLGWFFLGSGIGCRASSAKIFQPGHQFRAHAGGRWLRLVRKAGDQQRCHVLAVNADRTRAFPLHPHVFVDVVEIRTHVIRARTGALHQSRQGILVDPAQLRDSARIGASLGHRVGVQPFRNLAGIVGDRHRLRDSEVDNAGSILRGEAPGRYGSGFRF